MPKVSPDQVDFSGGEFGPLMYARTDLDRYRTGLEVCKNYIPTVQGPVTRRPGSNFVAEVKDSTKYTRLVEFEFSTEQAYMLEFGDQYVRFYRDQGQIISGMSAYEISTNYLEADLETLKFTQSADTLYIVHPDYPPAKLTRTGHTSWALSDLVLRDGPYLITNTSVITITPSHTSGTSRTLTASGSVFAATDVGRLVRILHSSTWGYAKITAYTSVTQVTADILSDFGATTGSRNWRLGVYYQGNYPSTVTFHEDRLGLAGAPNNPERGDLSVTGDYENFAPTAVDGTIASDNAVGFSLNSTEVNKIEWWASVEKGLAIGTSGAEWLVSASSGEALSPTNITAKRSNFFGSADIQPAQVGNAVLYVQREARKIRELSFFDTSDGFKSFDMTVLAQHITKSGIRAIAHQKEPYSIIWCVREDGVLLCMAYEREIESLKVGFSRNVLGGVSDALGNAAIVESVAVIPSSFSSDEEVWVVVKRQIDGSTVRYIEFLGAYFDDETAQRDAFFVDSGLTLDAQIAVTGATKANPVVITAASHGLSNGDAVLFQDVGGMTELNGNAYVIANVTTNTFELTDEDGDNIDGTSFGTYISGGIVRKLVTTIAGLDHLEGQSVSILADGAVLPNRTVTSGQITLSSRAAVVHVGLGYMSDCKQLRINAGAADGTAIGKTRRIHRLGVMLHRSLGLKIGTNFDELDEITFRTSSDEGSRAPELFSGLISETLEADYDFENQVCFRQDQPLPSTVLGLYPQMVTQDR